LDQGLDHWETVYALLEEETLNLFKDQDAASEVWLAHTHTTWSHTYTWLDTLVKEGLFNIN